MIDFNLLIDKYLHRNASQKKIGRYYPSEIGSCMRKVWYSYKHPKELGANVRKVFHMGNLVHDFVVEVLKSSKNPEVELLQTEMPIVIDKKKYILSGRVDNILLVKKSDEKVLVEVKSTKMLDMVKEPHTSHIMQLQLYLHATEIKKGLLLYVEKSTLESREFVVEYDDDVLQDVMSRFDLLHDHITKDEIPKPEAKESEKMKWMCNYCEYKDMCDAACYYTKNKN